MNKLTPAALRCLAFVHVTGTEPKGTHASTWMALFDYRDRQPFTLDGPSLVVNDAGLALIEGSALLKAVALFESHGFALPDDYSDRIVKRGKRTQYVFMSRESDGVFVWIGKCGTAASVGIDTGAEHPSTEYVHLAGKRATPLPEIVTTPPAALTADEADLLDLARDDGECVARAVRKVLDDCSAATPLQVEITGRVRAMQKRGLPGLLRSISGRPHRPEQVVPTTEGHRALNLRTYTRRGDTPLPHPAFMHLALRYRREAITERVRACVDPECTKHDDR